MIVSSAALDVLTSFFKTNAAAPVSKEPASPLIKSAETDETLGLRPATIKSLSVEAQAIVKKAKVDREAAEKLQEALAVIKGKDPKDIKKTDTDSAAKMFDIINGKTTEFKAPSPNPLANGDDLIETNNARVDKIVTRQEVMDFVSSSGFLEDADHVTTSWVDQDRAQQFKTAIKNGTLGIIMRNEIPNDDYYIPYKRTYWEGGGMGFGNGPVKDTELEALFGKHVNYMHSEDHGGFLLTWDKAAHPVEASL